MGHALQNSESNLMIRNYCSTMCIPLITLELIVGMSIKENTSECGEKRLIVRKETSYYL